MEPTFLLAKLRTDAAVDDTARSALPGAPVRPPRVRHRVRRWLRPDARH